jgi:hypothetical protein
MKYTHLLIGIGYSQKACMINEPISSILGRIFNSDQVGLLCHKRNPQYCKPQFVRAFYFHYFSKCSVKNFNCNALSIKFSNVEYALHVIKKSENTLPRKWLNCKTNATIRKCSLNSLIPMNGNISTGIFGQSQMFWAISVACHWRQKSPSVLEDTEIAKNI